MAITTAVITGGLLVAEQREKKKARKDQRDAARLERKKADIANAKQNRQRLAAARRARAATVAAGEGAGVGGSSVIAGAAGAVQTQAAANVGLQNQLASLTRNRLLKLDDANAHLARASRFSAIGGVITGAKGGLGQQLEGIFSSGGETVPGETTPKGTR